MIPGYGRMTKPDPMQGGEAGPPPPPPEPPRETNSEELGSNAFGALPSLELLERMQNGEDAARDELVRRYWPRLQRWARGRVPAGARDLYETDDLVQETMVTALGRLEDFEPEYDGALIASGSPGRLRRVVGRDDQRRLKLMSKVTP